MAKGAAQEGKATDSAPAGGSPRLPAGRHGLPREFVAHNQRERLIAGLAEAVAENGYSGTTIAHITRHAAVSRRTFYEHFASKDECFVAAYDTVMAELRERVSRGLRRRGATGRRRSRAGIGGDARFLAAEPNLARLCMVEALVAGPVVVERYDAAIQSFVPYFQAGREGRSAEVLARLSPTTEEALVGGMVSLISRRIIAGKAERAGGAAARPGRVHPHPLPGQRRGREGGARGSGGGLRGTVDFDEVFDDLEVLAVVGQQRYSVHVRRCRNRQVKGAAPGLTTALGDRRVQSPALARGLRVEGQRVEAILDDRQATHSTSARLLIGGQDAEVKLAE